MNFFLSLKHRVLLLALFFSFTTSVQAQDKQQQKLDASIRVIQEFGKLRESIPKQLMQKTEGIIIIPGLINAGFMIGGKRGKGIAMVKNDNGTWSNPVFLTMTGGSFGFQAGIQSVDLVLVFLNKTSLLEIEKSSFTLGGDISVAAGPLGRTSSAGTDYKLESEVYTYSRSKGLFAGISLSGSSLDIDQKANDAFYGAEDDAAALFANKKPSAVPAVKTLKQTLRDLYKK
ncbi:MAG: lipid-binding SYLF domain-containing protein [Mucilaginibacter sp.]|uniref:lipid-binding SYLF domain-containing protein n=1 Tax=Mucilaginibacter sp. TaxID=1882438 RepID=UPI0034E60777